MCSAVWRVLLALPLSVATVWRVLSAVSQTVASKYKDSLEIRWKPSFWHLSVSVLATATTFSSSLLLYHLLQEMNIPGCLIQRYLATLFIILILLHVLLSVTLPTLELLLARIVMEREFMNQLTATERELSVQYFSCFETFSQTFPSLPWLYYWWTMGGHREC